MPRPTTKAELLKAAEDNFVKMWKMIDSLPAVAQNAAFNFGDAYAEKEAHWSRDRNLRDVLVHLYEWHQLLLRWVAANQGGNAQPFLPAPYTWKTYGEMNEGFWAKHQQTPLSDAVAMLKQSHADVMQMIGALPEGPLFTKGSLTWTGTSTLGSYCVSATASHYDWAMKKLKVYQKTL